ncbi:glycosyltransferase family 1 protein [uncultured Brevundimonas sp.]|uniref:glycosyltransferase family 4 protein n=1 Tax=uncultured Brevundimonas sp. TaxID=213418 RepID=UPI0030ED793A|tara:strand:- start:25080 stop:26318 length:1239 start_codon:yes stop_codon:yes gene_type:complete
MKRTVLFDVGRLLDRTARDAPTGVDRVCLAYADWLASRRNVTLVPVLTVRNRLRTIDPGGFGRTIRTLRKRWAGDDSPTRSEHDLVQALGSGGNGVSIIGHEALPQGLAARRAHAVSQALASRPLTPPTPGQTYISVGHTSLNSPATLAGLARNGVSSLIMVHDLIPITHPEYCRPGDDVRHWTRVRTALAHASRIVVNSRYTADQLAAFAVREQLPQPPTQAIPLGLEPAFLPCTTAPADPPYFVHIGTIEARKNLAFLLTLWRRLQEGMGDACPRLVLIGRYGWENEAVLDHLQRSPNLQGLVHQVSGLPDAALVRLMHKARAVVAPSSVEGFDLPAVEAMAMGVPLIASDIPVHRELVAAAQLIDPLDGPGWLAALEAATRKRPIAPPYAAPTWAAHFDAVATFIGLDS